MRSENWNIVLYGHTFESKIQLVKVLRAGLRIGLKDAKAFADALESGGSVVVFSSENRDTARTVIDWLCKADTNNDLTYSIETPEIKEPTAIEIKLAIWIARELPVSPDDIRVIANGLAQTSNPVAALKRVADLIESA